MTYWHSLVVGRLSKFFAVKIRSAVPRPFAMDLIVRTPDDLKWRLANSDMFHTEIVTKGKVLYEASDARMGGQGRRRRS
jgi:hypothetical protein